MSSAGAGPSSAASATSAAAATAAAAAVVVAAAAGAGAPAGSVFVKRAGDARARFARVPILVGDAVTDLAERASLKLDWRTTATYVELFLVKPDGDDEPIAAEEEAALTQPRLQVGWLLSRARISSGAWVVARLPDPPAAAPGECARAARSLLSCSPSRGAGGARGTRARFRWVLRWALIPFPPTLPSHPSQAAAAAAAVAATWLQHPATRLFLHLFKRPWRTSCAARRAATSSGASSRLFTTRPHPAAHAALGLSIAWA
jgi:hypothetical protein